MKLAALECSVCHVASKKSWEVTEIWLEALFCLTFGAIKTACLNSFEKLCN